MSADVFAADEQHDEPVELERWVTLARQVLQSRGVRPGAEVSVLFVDEPTMAALNEQFLGRPGPTDVLAFPIEDEPVPAGRVPDYGGTGPGTEPSEEPVLLLGDVVVCPAVARRHSTEHGVAFEDELALLVVHGLLHLLGMDHQDDGEAERMEALERLLLARFHAGTPARPAGGGEGGAGDDGGARAAGSARAG